ncbi:MAG TPA: Arm DNA-binding domain-containing protein, partial [Halothiobacillus sp.]|nr:Arm DNA-binding domain-containing protein [Halothiobacillus sp.]
MAIKMLKEVRVRKALPGPGKRSCKLNDGGGLWLYVTHTNPTTKNPDGVISKSFVFRYTLGESKGQDLAIGPYPKISLSRARVIAEEFRDLLAQGICPKQHKSEQADQHRQSKNLERTFSEVTAEFIEAKQSEWTNPKHAQQVRNTLKTYAEVVMGKTPVSSIRVENVETVLRPIWNTKTETAKRVRNRIEQVIDFAIVKGYRPKEAMNPATWRGNLQHILTSPAKLQKEKHFDALPYDEQPEFTVELVAKIGRSRVLAAAPLLLVILTAS